MAKLKHDPNTKNVKQARSEFFYSIFAPGAFFSQEENRSFEKDREEDLSSEELNKTFEGGEQVPNAVARKYIRINNSFHKKPF